MSQTVYRYRIAADVSLEEVEATLLLALFAVESLHGEAQVRLDLTHMLAKEQRLCLIDAATRVGQDFNRLFTGFVSREFGADAFQVERLSEAVVEVVKTPAAV